MSLHQASLLGLFFLFIVACICLSEWAAHKEKVELYRPRLVKTINIDVDTEIERQNGWN